jgi:hypothetical protein
VVQRPSILREQLKPRGCTYVAMQDKRQTNKLGTTDKEDMKDFFYSIIGQLAYNKLMLLDIREFMAES